MQSLIDLVVSSTGIKKGCPKAAFLLAVKLSLNSRTVVNLAKALRLSNRDNARPLLLKDSLFAVITVVSRVNETLPVIIVQIKEICTVVVTGVAGPGPFTELDVLHVSFSRQDAVIVFPCVQLVRADLSHAASVNLL